MEQKHMQILKTVDGLLQLVKKASLPYEAKKLTPMDTKKLTALTHAREWLLMAVEAGQEAEKLQKAAEKSRCKITLYDCLRIRDQKMDLVKLSLERAVSFYAEYQKLMHSDVTVDILEMLVA